MVDNIQQTLKRLAHAFTVKDIMVPKENLVYASNESEARILLDQYPDFDVIPIDQKGVLSAYLERSSNRAKNIHTSVVLLTLR